MDVFIAVATVILIIAYIGVAIWAICKRQTVVGSVCTSVAFLVGSFVIISIAEAVASFICWAIVLCLAFAIIGAIFGS